MGGFKNALLAGAVITTGWCNAPSAQQAPAGFTNGAITGCVHATLDNRVVADPCGAAVPVRGSAAGQLVGLAAIICESVVRRARR